MDEQRRVWPEPSQAEVRAIEWLIELEDPQVSVECLAAWQRWLAEDPRHKLIFDELQATQEAVDAVPRPVWPTSAEIAGDGYDANVSVAQWRSEVQCAVKQIPSASDVKAKARSFRPGLQFAGTAVAVMAAMVLLVFGYLAIDPSRTFETNVGELRRVQLGDGSTITLGGHTKLTVNYESSFRKVHLARGEVFVKVAKDSQRPFIVQSGEASARAIGTAFNVRRANGRVTVAVAEGVVEVSHSLAEAQALAQPVTSAVVRRVTAGQQVRIESESLVQVAAVQPETVSAWVQGHRYYLAEQLADVIADLGRYSQRRVVIDDAEVGELQVTAAVFDSDAERWLRSLASALPVEVITTPDGIVHIRARH